MFCLGQADESCFRDTPPQICGMYKSYAVGHRPTPVVLPKSPDNRCALSHVDASQGAFWLQAVLDDLGPHALLDVFVVYSSHLCLPKHSVDQTLQRQPCTRY